MYGNRLKWFLKYGFCKKLLSDVLHSQFLPHTSDLDQNKSEVSSVSVPFLTLIVLLSQFLPNTSDLDQNKSEVSSARLNPNWHEKGRIQLFIIFEFGFVSQIFIKKFKTFLEVKIEINRDNLSPFQGPRTQVALKMSIFLTFIAHASQG